MIVKDYTALDIETTGLNPKYDKIIEVGAVKVRDGEIVEEFEYLVSPGRKLEQRITELTGITEEMLQDALLPNTVIPELLHFIGSDIILGHCVLFDYSFVKKAATNLSIKMENNLGIDTLKIARLYLSELESRSLPFLCKYYEIPHKAHRAVEDARATVRLYEKLVGNFQNEEKGFSAFPLIYQVKKEAPASESQKARLYKLIEKHKINIDYEVDRLSRNEINRNIDKIISVYGRV